MFNLKGIDSKKIQNFLIIYVLTGVILFFFQLLYINQINRDNLLVIVTLSINRFLDNMVYFVLIVGLTFFLLFTLLLLFLIIFNEMFHRGIDEMKLANRVFIIVEVYALYKILYILFREGIKAY